MSISELRERVSRTLVEFAWNEWSQMGVFATPQRESPWAADPEALLIFTFEVARSDPRLFDEVLDWLASNVKLLSLQRLRNLTADEVDERLADAAAAWMRRGTKGTRVSARRPPGSRRTPERLFYTGRTPTRVDESFREFGFLKPATQQSGKSQRPDLRRPINFALRLRLIFGVGSRAEVMRFLLTASVASPFGSRPLFTTSAITREVAFEKRNVHEALTGLVDAGVISQIRRGQENLYAVGPERWSGPLEIDDARFPAHRDWPDALHALRVIHRWLHQSQLDRLSAYMRASEARTLMERVEPSLRYAGIPVSAPLAEGAAYWDGFVDAIEQILGQLTSGLPW